MRTGLAAFLLATALLPGVTDAHHCAEEYNSKAPIELSGTITAVEWQAPHAYLHLTDGQGRKWRVMGSTAKALMRAGYTPTTLQPGAAVTVKGFAAFEESCSGGVCKAVGWEMSAEGGAPRGISGYLPSTANPSGAGFCKATRQAGR